MKKIFLTAPVLLVSGIIISTLILVNGKSLSDKGANPDRASFRKIRYGFTIQNRSDQLIETADFWAFAPVEETAGQRCINVASSHPCNIVRDRLGNQVLGFKLEKIPPYACRVITITADIEFPDTVSEAMPVFVPGIFLAAETGIESNHPAIIEQCRKLTIISRISTAARICDWVSRHIRYSGYSEAPMGAFYALLQKEGDCTEYAALFTALCRAADIPARMVGGYVCTQSGVLKPSDYHDWAEFMPEKKWRIADPQKRKFPTQNSSYVAMHIHGESSALPVPPFERFRISDKALFVRMNS